MRINSIGLMNNPYLKPQRQISMRGENSDYDAHSQMIDSESVASKHESYLIDKGVEPTVARDEAERLARCLKSVENH